MWRALRLTGLLTGALAASACGGGGMRIGTTGVAASSCDGLPNGACSEQADLAAGRHPGATQVELTCGVAVCDRRGGGGTAVVTLADGTRITEAFSYVGAAVPAPAPACLGLAPDLCAAVGRLAVDDQPPSKVVVSIEVSCAVAACTATHGDTRVKLRFADNGESTGGYGWDGGPP